MSIDPLNPRESLGFLAWKVARIVTNNLASRFVEAGIDITVEQWRALIPVYKLDGLSQGRLCKIMSQEKTGVSRLVAALEKRGLIRRESSKEDRRVKFLFITEAGREVIDLTIGHAETTREKTVEGLDPDEVAICHKVLWQIVESSPDAICTQCGGPSC